MNTRKFDIPATAACIGTLIFWTAGPIFIKLLTGYLDVWTQNLLRYSAASLFWLPFLLFCIKTKQIDHNIWRRAIAPAAANIVMQCFFAGSFYYIDPAFMILLTKSSIIWIAGFSLIFFADERGLVKSKGFWFGLGLSLAGVAGVLFSKDDFASHKTLIGIAMALSAAVAWGMYTVLAKIAFKDTDSRNGFAVVSLYTVVGLCVLAVTLGDVGSCLKMGARPWVYIVVSGLLSIAFTHVLYYYTIKRIGATIPSLVLLAQPFMILAASNVVFGESLNMYQWFFGIALLTGSAFAIWAQQHLTKNVK